MPAIDIGIPVSNIAQDLLPNNIAALLVAMANGSSTSAFDQACQAITGESKHDIVDRVTARNQRILLGSALSLLLWGVVSMAWSAHAKGWSYSELPPLDDLVTREEDYEPTATPVPISTSTASPIVFHAPVNHTLILVGGALFCIIGCLSLKLGSETSFKQDCLVPSDKKVREIQVKAIIAKLQDSLQQLSSAHPDAVVLSKVISYLSSKEPAEAQRLQLLSEIDVLPPYDNATAWHRVIVPLSGLDPDLLRGSVTVWVPPAVPEYSIGPAAYKEAKDGSAPSPHSLGYQYHAPV